MERIFYSPTQYAKEVKESNSSVTQINYFINFNNIRHSKDFDNYYVKPITIKSIGANITPKDIMVNISKQIYARMKLFNEGREDEGKYLCLRTDCTEEKIYSSIDGDHPFYSSKVLIVPFDTSLNNQLMELEQQEQQERKMSIESIENNFTL